MEILNKTIEQVRKQYGVAGGILIAIKDGKVLLKAEVAARLNQILGAQRVIRVYFTDFVVE